ncbi:MAG: hypothetical protein DWQ01_01645 [Planctomycetota bacterium]|nr:MAG: hypothetical protein DWQ01_01645 [Planctomycetota bacterium]
MKARLPFPFFLSLLFSLALATTALADWPLPPTWTGKLYLAGYNSHLIGEYSKDGQLLRTISHPSLNRPRGTTVDEYGNLVVVNEGNGQILVLDLEGNLIRSVTHPDLTQGTGVNRGPNGWWYVGNFFPGRVLVFDSFWNYQGTLTENGMNGVNCIAFDADGSFAVSAAFSNQVFLFNAQHQFQATVSHGSISSPMSIALDSQGNHYLSNGGNGLVSKFDSQWNHLMDFGTSGLLAPQGVIFDEHDQMLVTDFSSSTVYRFDDQGQWLSSFPLQGLVTVRNGGFQTSSWIRAREGAVAATSGDPEPVLAINGTTGDAYHRYSITAGTSLQVELDVSSAGPHPAPAVLYFWNGEPGLAEVTELSGGSGWFAFPPPFAGTGALCLRNSIGLESFLGTGLLPPLQAPALMLDLPTGVAPGTYCLQAILMDHGSPAGPLQPYSATNALVVLVN